MRVRIVLTMLVLLAGVTTVPFAHADDFLGIRRDFARRNCWPEPFVGYDRRAVQEPFGQMIARGWERQNMLSAEYFEDQRNVLTEAGRLKVRWILTEAPSQHRIVYVHRADDPLETQARMESVRKYAAQLLQGAMLPPILESSVSPPSSPADRVEVVSRKYYQSIPDPKLPSGSGSSSGLSGGGGGK
jgi:hypothetical protein